MFSVCIATFPSCCFVYLNEGQSKNIPLENDLALLWKAVHLYCQLYGHDSKVSFDCVLNIKEIILQ